MEENEQDVRFSRAQALEYFEMAAAFVPNFLPDVPGEVLDRVRELLTSAAELTILIDGACVGTLTLSDDGSDEG